MFYFLCSYKTGNLEIIIKESSFKSLCHDLLDPTCIHCCSFSSRIVNKMVHFCYEKVYGRLSFEAYVKNIREKVTKRFLKTTEVLLDADEHVLCLIFIKVQNLHIVLRAKQTLYVLIFFQKRFCLMSGLKLTLSDLTLFLRGRLNGELR